MSEIHKKALEEVRQDIARLEAEIHSLRMVEQYHLFKLKGDSLPVVDVPIKSANDLKHLTKHEAAEKALREIGRPAKPAELAEWLRSRGYGTDLGERILENGLYTAMKRKDDTFRNDGGTWSLAEWDEDIEGVGEAKVSMDL